MTAQACIFKIFFFYSFHVEKFQVKHKQKLPEFNSPGINSPAGSLILTPICTVAPLPTGMSHSEQ